MSVRVYPFDISKGLDSPEAIAIFMADIMESGDPSVIAGGIGEVAKASGMTTLSRMTGISREHLYKSFSETGNPTLKSLNAVMQAFGVRLSAKPIKKRRNGKPGEDHLLTSAEKSCKLLTPTHCNWLNR